MSRFLTFLALSLTFAFPALAADSDTPDAFLKGIYSHYGDSDKKDGAGVMIDSAAQLRRYFTADLVALIEADEKAAEKRGDVPTLDGDPFIDAQDWQVTDLKIHVDSQTATAAKATVTFENVKEPKVVQLDLVNTPKGWRIADIFWKGDGSLRALYKKK
jgi:hypothetical protein